MSASPRSMRPPAGAVRHEPPHRDECMWTKSPPGPKQDLPSLTQAAKTCLTVNLFGIDPSIPTGLILDLITSAPNFGRRESLIYNLTDSVWKQLSSPTFSIEFKQ
jgi:hypothetical protein